MFGFTDFPANVPLYFLRNLFLVLLTAPLVGWLTARTGPALTLILLGLMVTQPPIPYFGTWSIPFGFALGVYVAHRPSLIEFADRFGAAFLLLSLALSVIVVWQVTAMSDAANADPPRMLMNLIRATGIPACWWLSGLLIAPGRAGEAAGLPPNLTARILIRLAPFGFAIFCMHVPALSFLRKGFESFVGGTESAAYPIFFLLAAPVAALLCVAVAFLAERMFPRPWAIAMGRRTPATIVRPGAAKLAVGEPNKRPVK